MKYNPHIHNQAAVGTQWNGDCPFCGKERHFFMNRFFGLWDCKSCGLQGNWYQFKKLLKEQFGGGVVLEEGEEKKQRLPILKVKASLDEEAKEVEIRELQETELPESLVPISMIGEGAPALRYLLKRRFSSTVAEEHGMVYCPSGRFFNRIIIPIVMHSMLYAYIGRWVEIPGVKPKRKYRNNYGMESSLLLWNYDGISAQKPVVVTEGVFSGIRVGGNVVAAFGKKFSAEQSFLLEKKGVRHVVFLFDSDAKEEIIKAAERSCAKFEKVSVFFLENGDPDENRLTYQEVVSAAERFSPRKYVSFSLRTFDQKSGS
jgi:DNA primase